MGKAERQQKHLAAGWQALERKDPRLAEEAARAGLDKNPRDTECLRLLGASLFQQGRFQEAITPLLVVFQKARMKGIGFYLGHCHLAAGDPASATAVLKQEIEVYPDLAEAHNLLGISLVRQSRHLEALSYFASAIERAPRFVEACNNMGSALSDLAQHEEAIRYFGKAIEIRPDYAQAHNGLGSALIELERTEEAIASLGKAIELAPGLARAYGSLGVALAQKHRYDEAIAQYKKALAIDPGDAETHNNLGNTLCLMRRYEQGIASYARALEIRPGYADAHYNLGAALHNMNRNEEALASYDSALYIRPDHVEALAARAAPLKAMDRIEEAIASLGKALAVNPDLEYAYGDLVMQQRSICDWHEHDRMTARLSREVMEGKLVIAPFNFVEFSPDPSEQLVCAQSYTRDKYSVSSPYAGGRHSHDRIRIAYLSADFRRHPVAYCVARLFELHDRSRFEVMGVSFSPDDGSEVRARLMKGFDRFIDAQAMSDEETARLLHGLEVDICVDLMGYTKDCRPDILARRPAPVQASYLGFPGTMGADFIDYMFADQTVVPEEERACYAEKLVYLPESYQINDSTLKIAERTPARAELGLPEQGFVFCCFNANRKITPAMFDIWMRLLKNVVGSVLWLTLDNRPAMDNLRKEARSRGVDPDRLVFASKAEVGEYLARYRLADLFLDTLPYNAHGTGSGALWAGLPVLTCTGRTFAGRVGASLLRAVGLPELITQSPEEYEALALKLATEGDTLKELRGRLGRNRLSAPLFDTDRFRRHLESAYVTMWQTWQRGEQPRAFAVETIT